jgi:hypothetical protein
MYTGVGSDTITTRCDSISEVGSPKFLPSCIKSVDIVRSEAQAGIGSFRFNNTKEDASSKNIKRRIPTNIYTVKNVIRTSLHSAIVCASKIALSNRPEQEFGGGGGGLTTSPRCNDDWEGPHSEIAIGCSLADEGLNNHVSRITWLRFDRHWMLPNLLLMVSYKIAAVVWRFNTQTVIACFSLQ